MKQELLTSEELCRFAEGSWQDCQRLLGAHPTRENGRVGVRFAVWAPGARRVWVVGAFNDWNIGESAMLPASAGGVWQLFIPDVCEGDLYKYAVETASGEVLYKADPYAFSAQQPPETASRVCDLSGFRWHDGAWLTRRRRLPHRNRPLNIYEVHLGSWRRHADGGYLTYRELAETLAPYAADMGYTHIELLPVTEHPFDGSWGYQTTGYFAPTARYGSPEDFMAFVDTCHRAGLGVLLDWAPGHFCRDAHGLGRFNGEKLYEAGDHEQWGTYKFDLGRGEVRSFLTSSALFWLETYHIDGLRVDGVTSMLYLNFGIDDPGRKQYNARGGEENDDAVSFLRLLNGTVGRRCPDVMMIAEESTAWPLVTRPPEIGGLGFHYKWDMGWMNDTLRYMQTDFPSRPEFHTLLTFSMMYAFDENFVLPLSHDEVVHGKRSLIGRMPGDYWRQFAGVRLLALYQMTHPGGKLNFMGNEFAPFIEWRYDEALEWFLPEKYEAHRRQQTYIRALNAFYRKEKALWQNGWSWDGFQWLDANNASQSVLTFLRRGKTPGDTLTVLLNFVPETHADYRLGVPGKGRYEVAFSSDDAAFGGAGMTDTRPLTAEPVPWQGQTHSVRVTVPPVGGIVLKRMGRTGKKQA